MSWTDYLSESERDNLDDKAAKQFAGYVRKALFQGMQVYMNKELP